MTEVTDLSPYRAVVAGSAIHGGKWLPEAMQFMQANRTKRCGSALRGVSGVHHPEMRKTPINTGRRGDGLDERGARAWSAPASEGYSPEG